MTLSLFGSGTTIGNLRAGMNGLMTKFRGTTARIANASEASTIQGSFVDAMGNVRPEKPVDLESETAMLADTALRFDAAARLLTTEYASLRTAMRRDG